MFAWLVVAGLALADTVDLTDDMEVRPSPLQTLQQALDPDLDDLRQLSGPLKSNDQLTGLSPSEIPGGRMVRAQQSAFLLDPPRVPLYQRLSTYRI